MTKPVPVKSLAGRCRRALLLAVLAAPAAQALSLIEALERAAKTDPAVPSSLARYDAEREAGVQERSGLKPSLSARGSAGAASTTSSGVFGNTEDRYPSWELGVSARQPLYRYDWGARLGRATAREQLADLGLRERKQQLLRRIAERWFGVLLAQDALSQAGAEARAVSESLKTVRTRVELEVAPGVDLKEAQAREDLAQAAVIAAQSALATARELLSESVGPFNDSLPELSGAVHLDHLPVDALEAWLAAAREHSATVAAARQQLEVARANLRSRRAEALPSLDATASLGYSDTSEYLFGQETTDARAGIELNIPLYAGGLNASRLREAAAQQRSAEAELIRLRSEAELATRSAYRKVETGRAQVAAYEKALISAEAAERATRAGYDAGTRTITDVLDATSHSAQAAQTRQRIRYQLLLAVLELKQTAGSLSENDLAEIDRLFAASASASNQQ